MGEPRRRIFCSWHVDRAWRQNILKKVQGKENQADAYKQIRSIIQIMDENEFTTMFKALLTTFSKDENFQCFGKYLENNYSENISSWAYCHRKYAGLNTNMHIERMHRTIKYIYLKGKTSKRLDKTIAALMHFIRDQLFSRIISSTKGKVSSKIADIRKDNSLSLSENCVFQRWEGREK
uniref:MULE transposase domain-containing protein n=1 Tax=Cacopsylla melanoneura TaxID=428564 RepID=A0A8D9E6M1_9HEMI